MHAPVPRGRLVNKPQRPEKSNFLVLDTAAAFHYAVRRSASALQGACSAPRTSRSSRLQQVRAKRDARLSPGLCSSCFGGWKGSSPTPAWGRTSPVQTTPDKPPVRTRSNTTVTGHSPRHCCCPQESRGAVAGNVLLLQMGLIDARETPSKGRAPLQRKAKPPSPDQPEQGAKSLPDPNAVSRSQRHGTRRDLRGHIQSDPLLKAGSAQSKPVQTNPRVPSPNHTPVTPDTVPSITPRKSTGTTAVNILRLQRLLKKSSAGGGKRAWFRFLGGFVSLCSLAQSQFSCAAGGTEEMAQSPLPTPPS